VRDLDELFCDGSIPLYTRDEIEAVLTEMAERVESAASFAEGAEFRYGVQHTEVAFYSGAETLGYELLMLAERRLGFRAANA
jgi:hypothetical protein